MVIEADRCVGCDGCFIACKDEYVGNDYPPYSAAAPDTQYGYYPGATQVDDGVVTAKAWVKPGQNWMDRQEIVRGTFPNLKVTTLPIPCMHCDNAPCMAASKNGAIYKDSNGIVLIDPVLSVGQTQIPDSCPYGVIFWNDRLNIPQKCTFCAHLVGSGRNPKCVDQCHMKVIHFGDLDDPNSEVSKLLASSKAEVLHPEYGAKPKVYYVGIPKTFIKGKVVNSSSAYLPGATVTLTNASGGTVGTTTVDNYGDFEFDGLTTGSYTLSISLSKYQTKTQAVNLQTDTYLGDIALASV